MAWQGKPHTPTAPREVPPQSEALELFGPGEAPAIVRANGKGLSIRERFEVFHSQNGWVLTALERMAADAIGRGRRFGVKAGFEHLRWEWERATADPSCQFKLNNDYTALYGRLLIERHPDWSEWIETRRLRAV